MCKEYDSDQMEVIRTRENNSLKEAKHWLHIWTNEQSERFHYDRTVHMNYQYLYAEVIGEAPYINIEIQHSIQ